MTELLSLNSVFWTTRMQFWQRCSSIFAKLLNNLCAQNQKRPVSFLRNFFLSFFFWTCNLIFWKHWRIFTADHFKCFCSILTFFEKSTTFEKKSARSTSDTQTHSSYKPANLSGQKSKKVTQNPREKLPQQSFQQKVFFLRLFLGRHRR